MKRKQYRDEKIIAILKEHEAGASVPELARRHGVAENTIYRWKAKFGGMEVSDAKKLRALADFGACRPPVSEDVGPPFRIDVGPPFSGHAGPRSRSFPP